MTVGSVEDSISLNTRRVLAIRADAFALGKVRPHKLVLVDDDGHLAINPQQHHQVRCGNKIGKVNLHGSPLQKNGLLKGADYRETVYSKQNRPCKRETAATLR